ncbi:unnamed protein product, partial [Prorocentrum cordatum]
MAVVAQGSFDTWGGSLCFERDAPRAPAAAPGHSGLAPPEPQAARPSFQLELAELLSPTVPPPSSPAAAAARPARRPDGAWSLPLEFQELTTQDVLAHSRSQDFASLAGPGGSSRGAGASAEWAPPSAGSAGSGTGARARSPAP